VSKVAVKFLTKTPPYNAGEIAGFTQGVAESLVISGVAVYYAPAVLEHDRQFDASSGEVTKPAVSRAQIGSTKAHRGAGRKG